ncbi:MAG: hypothetical protein N2316_05810 [Spirochaetes bacterium]|nr:hypothetical protein [Spirochaetota bacterium]
MLTNNFDMRKWKEEQIAYFKKYMKNFPKGSKEYAILQKGIEELEKSL